MYASTLNYESHFFISGVGVGTTQAQARELSGIESLEIGYQNNANVSKPLGYKNGVTTINSPTSQTVSFSRYLIYNDPVLSFTGESGIMMGSFNYDNGAAYGFESGYLNSYSVNCAVGSVPKVNVNLVVYDEMRSGVNASGNTITSTYIPSQGSISATCISDFAEPTSTNRVVGFDYSLAVSKIPYYTIGKEFPVEVKHIDPIEYSATVQLEVDDFFLESGYTFLEARGDRSVSFSINGRNGTTLQSLSIPNACLVSEQLSSSADGAVRLTLNYIGHS